MRMRTRLSARGIYCKMEVSGWQLVGRLCDCILTGAFYDVFENDIILSSLQPPCKNTAWSDSRRRREILRLVYVAYDILLLRKWTWFDSWNNTSLSPLCWCLSYGYQYHTQGRIKEGKRLSHMLNTFTNNDECTDLTEKDAILQFLALLAGDITEPSTEMLDSSMDSGVFCYDIYPSSLFEQLPSSHTSSNKLTPIYQALDQAIELYTSSPGSGFRGYLSSQTMSADKTLSPSSLFDGLVHSTTSSVNCHLSLPQLPSHPDLINLLHHTTHNSPTEMRRKAIPDPATSLSPSSHDDILSHSWTGWNKRLPYITEAGADAVDHTHFLSRVHLPSRDLRLHPLEPHPPNDILPDEGGSSISRAFSAALSRLQQYRQTILDRYHDEPLIKRHVGLHHLEPITCLLDSAKNTSSLTGLSLLDVLYHHCCMVQGTPHYTLLLSLLSHTITPYTHFLSQWLFNGWLDEGEEFGIHSNHRSLQCKDHRYWSEGYTITESCTPTFLSQYSNIILSCGKVLNLLKQCCPQHPLCGLVAKCPVVTIATSLEQLKELTQQCQEYYNEVLMKVNKVKEQRQRQAEAIEQEAMEKILRARQKARQALLAAREEEEYIISQQKKKKAEWLLELQTRAIDARQMKVRRETEEKERDRELVAVLVGRDNNLTAHEMKLAEEAKSELISHYEVLSRAADQRRMRAEWRIARLKLSNKRQQWFDEHKTIITDMMSDVEKDDGIEDEIASSVVGSGVTFHQEETAPVIDQQTTPVIEHEPEFTDDDDVIPTANEQLPVRERHDVITHTNDVIPTPHVKVQQTHHESSSLLIKKSDSLRERLSSSHNDVTTYHNTRGVPPPSTIQYLLYPSTSSHDVYHTPSSRGQAPPTTIQHLLYPIPDEETTQLSLPSLPPDVINYPPTPVEPYTTFNQSLLDMMPQSDLLTPVIGLVPIRNGIETGNMLQPLSYLIDHSISLPLLTQNYLVNSALLDYFLTSCHVTSHFLCLKRFLLLEDGEFAHYLATHLFHKLLYGSGGSVKMMSPAFLNPLLQSALDSSLHGDTPNTQLLSFAVIDSTTPSHPHAVDALDCLHLRYKVEWPCNIVLTEAMIEKYNKIFHLLLQLRRVSWALKIVFTQIHQCQELEKQHKRQLQIQRHELQHFVDVMQSYITNQIFYLSWREFENDLANKVHSLDDLIKAHQSFIDKAIFRCLLSKKAAAVMKIIRSIFSSILRFSMTLTTTSLHPSSSLHHYNTMFHIHHKFRDAAGLLMKVIMKLVDRGYQPHLEDFLLRLNFNSFYG